MKTYRRTVTGLSGTDQVRFTLRTCPDHGTGNRRAFDAIVPAGCRFDAKVMIAVGLLRFILDYRRSEIQVIMESRGMLMSTGEISNLSREFLLRYYCIHRRHVKDLELDEYVLYLDGTGESGGEIVFMAKDGITGITMDAATMPSESSEYITPFLRGIRNLFGGPVAVLRDMGPAIREAVSEVFPGTLQIICHYHFVRDLGKDVFRPYESLRNAMVATKALAVISTIPVPDSGTGIMYAEKLWIAIASEYVLHPREIPSRFPFVLPYFEVLKRCIEVRDMLKRIIRWNASRMMMVKPVLDLHVAVETILGDPVVMEGYRIIARTWAWFESVRIALRVSRGMSSSSSPNGPVDISAMGKDLDMAMSAIMKEGEFTGGDLLKTSGIFRKRIDAHRSELLPP